MSNLTLIGRTATTFTATKELDEDAMAAFLQRFVDARLGVYLGSGGSGEGHALTPAELRRVYEIGVAVCGGHVAVNANPPEQHTPELTIEQSRIAIDAGIEVVNVYGPTSAHGFRPSDAELRAYFKAVLSGLKHPIALAPNPVIGYTPKATLIAEICGAYPQVVAVNLAGLNDAYFIELRDALTRDVDIFVPITASLHSLPLGAAGLLAAHANIIPGTFRQYLDAYEAGDFASANRTYADIQRFMRYVTRWPNSTPRWIKMAMKVLALPGGGGGLRPPYQMPSDAEVEDFQRGLLDLKIPEVTALAQAAGLAVP